MVTDLGGLFGHLRHPVSGVPQRGRNRAGAGVETGEDALRAGYHLQV
jgi:hypothetical protein